MKAIPPLQHWKVQFGGSHSAASGWSHHSSWERAALKVKANVTGQAAKIVWREAKY